MPDKNKPRPRAYPVLNSVAFGIDFIKSVLEVFNILIITDGSGFSMADAGMAVLAPDRAFSNAFLTIWTPNY
jgi:hypothetical protein